MAETLLEQAKRLVGWADNEKPRLEAEQSLYALYRYAANEGIDIARAYITECEAHERTKKQMLKMYRCLTSLVDNNSGNVVRMWAEEALGGIEEDGEDNG